MKTALLLIDIQNDYFPGGKMELVESIHAAAAAARLLGAFRRQKWPVYHVRHISSRPTATFFLPDTPGAEIHDSLHPLVVEPVITKHFPNSFRETDLLERLRDDSVGSLLICGMMSHMCVDATTRAAFDLGFSCIVTHDACATRELAFNGVIVPAVHVHASSMAALGAVYAQVKGVDEIVGNIADTH
ncbi:MAG: isochorismatase family protein [Geobacter sp.]|nr:isochorismatase family protein [Geobacter sp.]